jgi:hypothetical protein
MSMSLGADYSVPRKVKWNLTSSHPVQTACTNTVSEQTTRHVSGGDVLRAVLISHHQLAMAGTETILILGMTL